jgi:hypothetical protein
MLTKTTKGFEASIKSAAAPMRVVKRVVDFPPGIFQ